MQHSIISFKKILLGLVFLMAGFGVSHAQDSIPAPEPEPTQKPLAKSAFESGICMDNQTGYIPPAHTLEFVLQHRFGTMEKGWLDIAGLWAPANIRLGLNFSITKNLLVGLGTTKNSMLQDLQLKYTFFHQRKGGFPLTITYYGDFSLSAVPRGNYGYGYKFVDRFAWYHQIIISRRFCKMFSMQIGLAYTHFNWIDTTGNPTLKHDALEFSVLARAKVSPQSSVTVSVQQPAILNYDPAFIIKHGNSFMEINNQKAPYANFSIGWEDSTSTHAFQIYLTAGSGIIPSEIVMHNTHDFFNGENKSGVLLGFNLTRLWGF